MAVYVKGAEPGSYADRYGIGSGCTLLTINGNEINDVLDYRFYMVDTELRMSYKRPDGKFAVTKIRKRDEYDDPGLIFDTYLMDKQLSCRNKCVFCFVDQLPKGMRESLYFKDDDSRMSFFYGNYITLTNLKQKDIDRIIKMHISPVNVSVHTMNPSLRCKMMNNRFAGESLDFLRQLALAGIKINTQLVLCPGINDGDELEFSVKELWGLYPAVQSVACVPVGLTDHREGLYELEPYTKESALSTLKLINELGDSFKRDFGVRFCYAADEFYLKAESPIPNEDYYDGYPQLDNGVGLMRLLESEVDDALEQLAEDGMPKSPKSRSVAIATGVAAYPLIKNLACKVEQLYNTSEEGEISPVRVKVFEIKNSFFGRGITVCGLITGKDLIGQMKQYLSEEGEERFDKLLISESMVRTTYPQDDSDDDVLLDDVTVKDIERELGFPVHVVPNDGYEFVKNILEV